MILNFLAYYAVGWLFTDFLMRISSDNKVIAEAKGTKREIIAYIVFSFIWPFTLLAVVFNSIRALF